MFDLSNISAPNIDVEPLPIAYSYSDTQFENFLLTSIDKEPDRPKRTIGFVIPEECFFQCVVEFPQCSATHFAVLLKHRVLMLLLLLIYNFVLPVAIGSKISKYFSALLYKK